MLEPLPDPYRAAFRTVLRFAIVMVFIALLSGILYQESVKKLDYSEAAPGLHLEAVIHLALVHGHVFLIGVLLPIAMIGAAALSLGAGGRAMSGRSFAWLTRVYMPFATFALALMLYKGYHVLLSVRAGSTDLGYVYDDLFAGVAALRHTVYAVAHIGMSLGLGVFVVALWRSMKKAPGGVEASVG